METEKLKERIQAQEPACAIHITATERDDTEGATLAVFAFEGAARGTSAAIVYDTGECFALADWQAGRYPATLAEVAAHKWHDHEHGTPAVILRGLPRTTLGR